MTAFLPQERSWPNILREILSVYLQAPLTAVPQPAIPPQALLIPLTSRTVPIVTVRSASVFSDSRRLECSNSRGAVLGFDLRAVEIIHGLQDMCGGAENRASVVPQHFEPACAVDCMIPAHFRRNAKMGGKTGAAAYTAVTAILSMALALHLLCDWLFLRCFVLRQFCCIADQLRAYGVGICVNNFKLRIRCP